MSPTIHHQTARRSSWVMALRLLSQLTICLFLLAGCRGSTAEQFQILETYQSNQQYFPGTHWDKLAKPELAGWSSDALAQARQYSKDIHSAAVVIVDNGVIVASWGNVTTRYKLHSVRKSIMDIMIGIAVDAGRINPAATLDSLGISDIGGLSPVERRATVADLLASRSGVYHPAAYETPAMRVKRPNRGSHEPGTQWFYNNWDFNTLLTIYNQQTGKDFFHSFTELIATPLKMEQFRIQDTNYYSESDISEHPAYLFRMSALDLARFGLLCLREGAWEKGRIVSADWIRKSTQPHTVFNPERNPERGYGYLWWTDQDMYYAAGTGGHRIFIVPDMQLVIVHRTDTDSRVRIKSTPIWRLFSLIVQAKSNHGGNTGMRPETEPAEE